jgi:hypothetical protein
MKKVLPVMLAVAAFAVAAPALPVYAQDAAAPGAQAGDPEAAANALYQTWKAETDPAKKAELGKQIVTQHFGTKAAEAIGYAGIFDKTPDGKVKLEMSKAYWEGSVASGKQGAYLEYALGNVATLEKDPRKAIELGRTYMQKFPGGKFEQFVKQGIAASRYKIFDDAVKAKNWTTAIESANEAFAANENEFLYAYVLTNTGLADLTAQGANSQFVGKVGPWADRAAKFVESGQMPAGGDKAKWDAEKPNALALLYKAQAIDKFLQVAKSNPADPASGYQPVIDLLQKAATFNEKDPVIYYYLAQVHNAQYSKYAADYDALPEADKTGEPGKMVLEKVNKAADDVINSYVRVIAYSGPDSPLTKTVQPSLEQLWKFRHEAAPDGWQDEIKKIPVTAK